MDFLTVTFENVPDNLLRNKLDEFSRDRREVVSLQQYDWEAIWRELVNVGIYKHGADLAEIGSTWLESLVAMNALIPFDRSVFDHIGGQQAFFPAIWQNVFRAPEQEIWGVPFRADVRLIFFWKDMFENAGVDPESSFSSSEKMRGAFQVLVDKGVKSPWGVPTSKSAHNTVYNVASWVWESGGQFASSDGKRVELTSHSTWRGIRNYFELSKYLPQEKDVYSDSEISELFARRKVAATITGPWLLNYLRNASLPESLIEQVGVALPPGPSFVGGTVFVIWQHTRQPHKALELIKYLSKDEFQIEFCKSTGLLPVRQDLWTEELLNTNKYMPIFLKGIQEGRGLPPIPLWGMIEERLTNTFGAIWNDIYSTPKPMKPEAIHGILAKHLEPLDVRLNMALRG
jgi:multiple sugar transport system substrate-binding protein